MSNVTRRDSLKLGATVGILSTGCQRGTGSEEPMSAKPALDPVLSVEKLSFPWHPPDPFLACMHHDDHYPKGDERMAPTVSLSGRDLGQDFSRKDGFSMYHGRTIPGFPQHPHRGFETVTVVRQGLLDHSDSLGAAARFGNGDVQWLTAGGGILHSEMFPLLKSDQENPLELFQIWLNLPARDKMVKPHFTMLWHEKIPRVVHRDSRNRSTTVTVVAGKLGESRAPSPPPNSWASRPESDLAIWTFRMEPGAEFTLPAASAGLNRSLYFFLGTSLRVAGRNVESYHSVALKSDEPVLLQAGPDAVEILMLQGRPIGEPVVQYGPFVMNTRTEIQEAFADYQRTQFGGWPWPGNGPVHARDEGRFARLIDGKLDRPV